MSAPVQIVGLCGYARSGKDTAASGLPGYVRVAFADLLKAEVAAGLGLSAAAFARRMSDEPGYKEMVRPVLVEWGRFRRRENPGYWIEAAQRRIVSSDLRRVVVTDVRYANEADWIRGFGGIVVRVDRSGVGPANEEERNSMVAFRPDFAILNDSTVEDLRGAVREIVTRYYGEQDHG